jgi:hypothetical protein
VRVPVADGLKRIVTLQLAPAPRLAPHVFVEIVKSPELVPETVMLLMDREEAAPFIRVVVSELPAEPTVTLPNERLDGLADTDPVTPRPVSGTFCMPALSLNVNVAVNVPVVNGRNKMVAVQLAPAARLLPHVLLPTLKSPLFVPEIAMLPMLIDPVPLLVNVTGFGPPVFPIATLYQLRLVGETVPAARQLAPLSSIPENKHVRRQGILSLAVGKLDRHVQAEKSLRESIVSRSS